MRNPRAQAQLAEQDSRARGRRPCREVATLRGCPPAGPEWGAEASSGCFFQEAAAGALAVARLVGLRGHAA